MATLIEPRTLKGFRDYPPDLMLPRERVLATARDVYRSYGYAPIDTPALEYADVLLGKGGGENDRIVYRFKDHGDRDVALRFDLTVPFARFAAQYVPKLGTPFKRYAMGPVWRGENTSAGRYREFWQCDFDVIGTTANAADFEVLLVINELLERLEFRNFQIRINDRRIMNGIFETLGLSTKGTEILRAIDKLPKIGEANVRTELDVVKKSIVNPALEKTRAHLQSILEEGTVDSITKGDEIAKAFVTAITGAVFFGLKLHEEVQLQKKIESKLATLHLTRASSVGEIEQALLPDLLDVPDRQINYIFDLLKLDLSNLELLDRIDSEYSRNANVTGGTSALRETLLACEACGIPGDRVKIDLTIARGLDYYTGTIYETFLTDLPKIGSVCSGGRYDNLASTYTKQVLPGVGASLGVDRLLAAMEELKHPWLTGQSTPAPVLVLQLDAGRVGDYQKLAKGIRAAGVGAEVYPDAKKLGVQFQYAEKRGHRLAVIAGKDEFDSKTVKIKDLAKREELTVPIEDLPSKCRLSLGMPPP